MSFVFNSALQSQGKGAKVQRIVGGKFIKNFDPFLMLDYAKVRLPAGFPEHPHRGFETVAYILKGSFYHQDFLGRKGKTEAGDLNWMTAGRGIVHSEILGSFQEDSVGFQLWINLKSVNKMDPPAYQQFSGDKIEVYQKDKASVKIISGQWEGRTGPIKPKSPIYYFYVHIQAGGKFDLPIANSWNSLIFVYEGEAVYQGKSTVGKQHCCVLEKGENNQETLHSFASVKGASFILIGGEPLNEPVYQYGPFVMNTKQEVEQAFSDYHSATNGFENAKNWQ